MVRLLPGPASLLWLATCAAAVAAGTPAHAVLSIYIYESGSDVQIDASGSLNLPLPVGTTGGQQGMIGIFPNFKIVGTGALGNTYRYSTGAGPVGSLGSGSPSTASSSSGTAIYLFGSDFNFDSTYTSGAPIVSSALITGTTLAQLGLSASSGLLATWTLQPANGSDPYTANDTIQVFAGTPPAPPAAAAPGPLPLFGAAAAFGFSRRLRSRLNRQRARG